MWEGLSIQMWDKNVLKDGDGNKLENGQMHRRWWHWVRRFRLGGPVIAWLATRPWAPRRLGWRWQKGRYHTGLTIVFRNCGRNSRDRGRPG